MELLTALAPFALMLGVLTITPGADTALLIRSATVSPRRAWGVVVGVQFGVLAWGLLASIGVAALFDAVPTIGFAVRAAGAAYLLWIGSRLLVSAARRPAARIEDGPLAASGSFLTGLRQGGLTNLLNPKVGAFYVAVVSQVGSLGGGAHFATGMALAGIHVAFGASWLGALALLAQSMGSWLRRPAVASPIDGLAGVVITGFGIALGIAAVVSLTG
ncbi:LysE family translocator [Agromyces aurantiacus]|uniref:LysE family translocator n=1 Tax=Agromyces aurantiacus TaxID=165814 RepID=A0ABV9R3P6_9MICO|nr:LysE family translocator [Agromyces aurantiacus]MBM7502798.1 threonine/homoserine/homoserine lactone efflux protein [Agromyces aurantiacus]